MADSVVVLKLPYVCSFGQSLAVSGSLPALGNWNPSRTSSMVYLPELQFWKLELNVSGETEFDYKYLIKDDYGNIHTWEGGDNRVHVPSAHKVVEHRDYWQPVITAVDYLFQRTSALSAAIYGRHKRMPKEEPALVLVPTPQDSTRVRFTMHEMMSGEQALYITGSSSLLGYWDPKKAVPLSDAGYPSWQFTIDLPHRDFPLEYKYLIKNSITGEAGWETGENRLIDVDPNRCPELLYQSDYQFRGRAPLKAAGVAIPVFSLRSHKGLGVGEFTDIPALVDWAKAVLPLNDTSVTGTWWDSYPYSSLSVFALHPIYINLDELDPPSDVQKAIDELRPKLNEGFLQYEEVIKAKMDLLRRIFVVRRKGFLESLEFQAFFEENQEWLRPYALFCKLRDINHTSNFYTWPKYHSYPEIPRSEVELLTSASHEYWNDISFCYYVQFHLASQLSMAADYAKGQGIALKGDLPIGVDPWSVDTWVYPHLFRLNKQTGAPPDPFSTIGQNWGFPTYDWDAMAKENYHWWRMRLTILAKYFHTYLQTK